MISKNSYTIKVLSQTADSHYCKYAIDCLPKSEGHTLGNALRRTLLHDVTGSGVSAFSLQNLQSYGQPISGAVEDSTALIMSLRKLRVRKLNQDTKPYILKARMGEDGTLRYKDFLPEDPDIKIEIMNPEEIVLHSTSKNSLLSLKVLIETNIGFASTEREFKAPVDIIGYETTDYFTPIDVVFSPVLQVAYEVKEQYSSIDTECLILEIETKGDTTPREACLIAMENLKKSFTYLIELFKTLNVSCIDISPEMADEQTLTEIKDKQLKEAITLLEDDIFNKVKTGALDINEIPGLTPELLNALADAKIITTAELTQERVEKLTGVKDPMAALKQLQDLNITLVKA